MPSRARPLTQLGEPRLAPAPDAPAGTCGDAEPAIVGHDVERRQRAIVQRRSRRRKPLGIERLQGVARRAVERSQFDHGPAGRGANRIESRRRVRRRRAGQHARQSRERRIVAVKAQPRGHRGWRRDAGAGAAAPPPHNHKADNARQPGAFARQIVGRAMHPHFDFGGEAAQFTRGQTRGQRTSDIRVEQPRRIHRHDRSRRQPRQQKPARAGIVQLVRRECASEFFAPSGTFGGGQARQSAIEHANVIEPRLQIAPASRARRIRPRTAATISRAANAAALAAARSGRPRSAATPRRQSAMWVACAKRSSQSKWGKSQRLDDVIARIFLRQIEVGENQRQPLHALS